MTISVGDKLPEVTFMHMSDAGPAPITTEALFSGKNVGLFAPAGCVYPNLFKPAFASFIQQAEALREKGLDTIICLSVNDALETHGASSKMPMAKC